MGKERATIGVQQGQKVQSTIESTGGVGKEVDQFHFSVESVKEIYDDWVNTPVFNLKKDFSMK